MEQRIGPDETAGPEVSAGSSDVVSDADLTASLAGLAKLSAGRVGLLEMLTRVAMMAVHAIPRRRRRGVDAAGAGP